MKKITSKDFVPDFHFKIKIKYVNYCDYCYEGIVIDSNFNGGLIKINWLDYYEIDYNNRKKSTFHPDTEFFLNEVNRWCNEYDVSAVRPPDPQKLCKNVSLPLIK